MEKNKHGEQELHALQELHCMQQEFREETDTAVDGYSLYKRRDNSNEDHMCRDRKVDNSFVVPYNPYLSRKYQAHILKFVKALLE